MNEDDDIGVTPRNKQREFHDEYDELGYIQRD
jgi:hypothetical protein